MAGSLAERLQLVVDATTTGAEASFARLSGAAKDTGQAAQRSAEQVADAAQRVAVAQAKEADAARAVEVAQLRLAEVREKGNATASQIAAAEARVEKAQRQVHLAARETTQSIEAQTVANREAVTAANDAGQATERMGVDLKGLATRGLALMGGFQLGDWARDAFDGFLSGSRGAQAMATSMNSTVEEAGAFLGLVGSVGLELDDLIEIQAEFASKAKDGLTAVGTELLKNNDGTVNWTGTIVDSLAALQRIPDATERNRIGFASFGEEGYKQLTRLLNSGVDVKDALAAIGTPFSDEDVALTREFDQVMSELRLESGDLGRTLGRELLPFILGLVDAGQTAADIIGAIPGPVAAAAGVAVLLGIAMRSAGTEGSFLAGAMTRASASVAAFRATAALTSTPTAALGVAGGAAAGAGRAMLSAFGGPLGVALVAAGVGFTLAKDGAEDLKAAAHDAAVEIAKVEAVSPGMGASAREMGQRIGEGAGYWERGAAAARGYREQIEDQEGLGGTLNRFFAPIDSALIRVTGGYGRGEEAAAGFGLAVEDAKDELGAYGAQQEVAQIAQADLNTLIAEGDTTSQAFADAVRAAAQAQNDASATQDTATAAIAAYNAVTREAVQNTLDLYSAQLGSEQAYDDLVQAAQDAATAEDDATTNVDERRAAYRDLMQSVLDYGQASADTAVANAEAAGQILTPLSEAQIRADATIQSLKDSLNVPDLTDEAKTQINDLITRLEAAKTAGDIDAVLSLTGASETEAQIDQTTEDRETTVTVESRNGPAVIAYLDSITKVERLAPIRIETRNGPAVLEYLSAIVDANRLALIRAESRGGPAVVQYLDSITSTYRLAIINVETRGGPAVQRYLDSLTADRTAVINARGAGGAYGAGLRAAPSGAATVGAGVAVRSVELDLKLTGSLDRAQVSRAERGRAHVEDIRAYEQRNGTGWRRTP